MRMRDVTRARPGPPRSIWEQPGSAFRNAGESQSLDVVIAGIFALEGIARGESLDREARFDRQQLVDVSLRLLAPPEMAERGDQRLVTVAVFRRALDHPPSDLHSLLVVALHHQ